VVENFLKIPLELLETIRNGSVEWSQAAPRGPAAREH